MHLAHNYLTTVVYFIEIYVIVAALLGVRAVLITILGILHVDYESLIPYLSESIKQNYNDIQSVKSDVDRVNKVIDAMYEQYVRSLKGQHQSSPMKTKADRDVHVPIGSTNGPITTSTRWLKVVIAILISVVAALGLVMALVILPTHDIFVPMKPLQPPHPTDDSENLRERAILLELFYALDGPHWVGQTFWPVDDKRVQHCSWTGVDCDDAGRVTSIYLIANMFNGTLPASIGNLKDLRILWLSVGHIYGPLPTSIGQLSKLEKLQISYANMEGELPDLRNLTSLKTIGFDGNKFSGTMPEHYLQLPSLESLDLSLMTLTGTLPEIITSTLKYLDLSINNLNGTIPDYSSSNLKNVDLSFNKFHGSLPPLGRYLTSLIVPRNYLNGTFDGSGYKYLKEIDLRGNALQGAFDLPAMNVSSLTHLDIAGNQFTSFFSNTPMNTIVAKYCKATENSIECPILTWVAENCEVECQDSSML